VTNPDTSPEPLTAEREAQWRAYIEAACREVTVVKDGIFDMSARLFATLDAARAAGEPGLREAVQNLLNQPTFIGDEGFEPTLVAVSAGHLAALRAALSPSSPSEPA
jgi:hypothetical protein